MPEKLQIVTAGKGYVQAAPPDGFRLLLPRSDERKYHNAQVYDYVEQNGRMPRMIFRHSAPLTMTVTAYSTRPAAELVGTAGFGFWNHPFSPDMFRFPRLPRAIWFFFAAPPSNMALAYGVAGSGWKAATIDSLTPRALALMPLALPAALLMRRPSGYERLFPPIQRALKIAEKPLDLSLLSERHTYTLEWRTNGASFYLDGSVIFETPYAPRGALGFVAWMDNRWAVVTPQGRFGAGTSLLRHEQEFIIENITIT